MPKITKDLAKYKHPNSRKTIALIKRAKKVCNRQKNKMGQNIKQALIGEKLMWFKSHLIPDVKVYSAEQANDIIELYLRRFDEELEQIELKHSIGGRTNRQHASREDVIRFTQEREREEYDTCGIEMPDIMNEAQLNVLRTWNGELRILHNFKFRRIGKPHLK